MTEFMDKAALITGGGRGIGLVCARLIAQRGGTVALQARVAAYATSKGGLLALTRSIAVAFGASGVRANVVCPGCIDAPMARFSAATTAPGREEQIIRQWGKAQPLGRVGRPEEIAEVVAFLTSGRVSFCTGAEFKVDGGLMARLGVGLPD